MHIALLPSVPRSSQAGQTFRADLTDVGEAADEAGFGVRRVHTVGQVECHARH